MQTKTILSAVLATISYLEAVQGAPMSQSTDSAIDWSSLPHDTLFKPIDRTTVDKRKTSIGSIATSALKSGGLSALESGAQDLWDDFTDSDDSSSTKRSTVSSLKKGQTLIDGIQSAVPDRDPSSQKNGATAAKRKTSIGSIATSALKSGGLSALESGAQDLWDDFTDSDDSSSTKRSAVSSILKEVPTLIDTIENFADGDSSSMKRSAVSSILKEVPTLIDTIENFADDDSSSSSKRSWASLIDKAEPYIESAAESAAKSVGGAVGSEVVSAGQSLASDVGLSKRKINWGNIIESGATAGATAAGSGIGSTIADGVETLASDVGINVKERSATFDAELPKRTGILTKIEHGIEDFAPLALGALADAKRSTTDSAEMPKRSGILTKIEHGIEDFAPLALGALADAKRDNVARMSVNELESLLASQNNKRDIAVPRSSVLKELESVIDKLNNKRDTLVTRSVLDELESFLGNL